MKDTNQETCNVCKFRVQRLKCITCELSELVVSKNWGCNKFIHRDTKQDKD